MFAREALEEIVTALNLHRGDYGSVDGGIRISKDGGKSAKSTYVAWDGTQFDITIKIREPWPPPSRRVAYR